MRRKLHWTAVDLLVGPDGEVAEQVGRDHRAASICCHSSFLASSAGDRLPRCW